MTEQRKSVTRAEFLIAVSTALDTGAAAAWGALPADPPASAGHNHAGDFCDPLTCPWRPASADAEATIKSLEQRMAGHMLDAAAIRAEALDVERFLAAFDKECEDALNVGIRPSGGDELKAWNYVVNHFRQVVPLMVREARLTKDAER